MSKHGLTNCFTNLSSDIEIGALQEQLHKKTVSVFKLYYGYLAIPFALAGLILSVIFIIAVLKAIKQHRVSRKCYVLIINRSVGDVLACVASLCTTTYILIIPEPNRDYVQVLDTFFIASFWSAMISYVSLSLLKLYAVAKPFNYRKTVTMKRVIYLVVISWCFFLFVLMYTLGVTAAVKVPYLRHLTGCIIETCLRNMYRSRNTFMACIYVFTIICFLFTVMFINQARRFVNSFHQKDSTNKPKLLRNRFPMWKLALNVATFAGFNSFYVVWALYLLYNTDICLFQRNFALMMKLLGIIRLTLMARIIVDPILSFITDFQIKRSMLNLFGIKHGITPYDSRKPFQKSISEENSSDCGPKPNRTNETTDHKTSNTESIP